MALEVASLRIHPLKGARALNVAEAAVEPRGLAGDRRFVATDEDGTFLTQRNCPALARVTAEFRAGRIRLSSDDLPDSLDAVVPVGGERCEVVVWRDQISAAAIGPEADAWVSRAVGQPARLFHFDARSDRMTHARFSAPAPIGFADAYPILVATTGSLDALNAEIARSGGAPIGMERFRPNIVIAAGPWEDDFWETIEIGGIVFDLVKPSDRCIVTTTDQRTGARMGKEPLASLARIRLSADDRIHGVLFGWNTIPRSEGALRVGDVVRIVSRRAERWPLATRA